MKSLESLLSQLERQVEQELRRPTRQRRGKPIVHGGIRRKCTPEAGPEATPDPPDPDQDRSPSGPPVLHGGVRRRSGES